MAEKIPVLTFSIQATTPLVHETFATWAGAAPTAGANVAGVAASDANVGDWTPVQLLGIAIVNSGGAVAAGALVSCDANGNAITQPGASPNTAVGRAIDAATAAGQRIRVSLIPN